MLFKNIKNLKKKKKTKISFYIKFFKFKIFIFKLDLRINKNIHINTIKIFKLLLNINNFGVFINKNLKIENNWIFPFWKNGFISNFLNLRWYFIHFFFLKKLPIFIINLTQNPIISLETINKNIPLINFFKTSAFTKKKNIGDYFFSNFFFFKSLDNIFFIIKILKYIKKYKNV